jgi:hypothetical protein
VTGAASLLALAALAIDHRHRFIGNLVTDSTAGASARVGFAHLSVPF